MKRVTFKVERRIDRPCMRIIHAIAKEINMKIKIYLDNETGDVMYPITIEYIKPSSIMITLDSEVQASCVFPPFLPVDMLNRFIKQLKLVNKIVLAARKLIQKEQKRFKKETEIKNE